MRKTCEDCDCFKKENFCEYYNQPVQAEDNICEMFDFINNPGEE